MSLPSSELDRSPRRAAPGDAGPFPLGRRARARLPLQRELSALTTWTAVVGLSILAAGIRLLVTHGLSVDELNNLDAARASLDAVTSHAVHGAVQPPLYPLLEWVSVHLFGPGAYAARAPSLVAGTLLVPVAARLAAELFARRTAIAAALIVCLAPVLVWYSQEASPYATVALLGALATLGAVSASRSERIGGWVLHTVAASLVVWTDWSGIPVVIATELVLLTGWARRRRTEQGRPYLARWALASLALSCQLVPLGLLFASQIRHGGGLAPVFDVGASGASFYTSVSNLSWALFGFHPGAVTTALAAVWPLAMLASLVAIGRQVGTRELPLGISAAVPALAVIALGLTTPGSYDIRFGLAGVVPLMILMAWFATAWPRGLAGAVGVSAVIAACLGVALADQQIDPRNPRRYDYGSALAAVTREARRGDAVLFAPVNLRAALRRYAPALKASLLTKRLPTRHEAPDVLVVASFTGRPAVRALLNRDLGALRATRHLVRARTYPGVQVWWFR